MEKGGDTMKNFTTREILLIVFLIAGKIIGKTKIQKLFYLLEREQKIPIGISFTIYLYGPFSRQLTKEIEALEQENVIQCILNSTYSHDIYYEYNISDKGMKEAMKLWESLPTDIKEKIIKHVSKFNSMTPTEIVNYVYENYPEAKPVNE